MLSALRNFAKTFVAKILMALLVLSFGAWGIHDFVNQINPSEVGRAGDTPVPVAEFNRAFDFSTQNFTEQQRRAPTPEENQAIAGQVLQSMLAEALQVDAARSLGLNVSDAKIAERIRSNEDFGGTGGFVAERFRDFLGRARISERDYVARERDGAVQELWVNSLAGGVTAPSSFIEAINRYANQTRVVSMFTLTEDSLGAIPDPSEEELKAFFEANKEQFRSPERRTFSVLSLSPEALADPAAVGTDAVRAAYDAEGAYGSAEKRTVSQVIVADRAAASAAADRINGGEPFEAVLTSLGQKLEDVALGEVARGDILNADVATAAFALESGKASVVDTPFGTALVFVSGIDGGEKQPFEAVEPEIRKALALDEAVDQVRGLETSVVDAVAGGEQVADIAARYSLPVVTISGVDRSGTTQDGGRPAIPGASAVLADAFGQAVGDDAVETRDGDDVYFVQVDTVQPPADREYDDVGAEVIAAWTAAEKRTRLKVLADEALAAVKAGTPPAGVAARYGVPVLTTQPFSRAAPAQDVPDSVVAAAFEGPQGYSNAVPATSGGYVVFEVESVEEPIFFEDAADLAGIRQNLDEGMGSAITYDAMNAWQAEVGATINQPIVDAVVTGQPTQR